MLSSDYDFLRHILDEAMYLKEQSAGINYDTFIRDETLQRAFVRSLEVIGEASKKISKEFKNDHTEIDWRAMAGMRDKLIHDYFGVDYEIVWDVVKTEIPGLVNNCQQILQK